MKLHTSCASLSERNWGFTQCERCKAPHANLCNEGAKCWRERSLHFETLTSNSDHFITNTNKARLGKVIQCYHRLHCLILLKWIIQLSLSEPKQMHIYIYIHSISLWLRSVDPSFSSYESFHKPITHSKTIQVQNRDTPSLAFIESLAILWHFALIESLEDLEGFQSELQILLWRSVRFGTYVNAYCLCIQHCIA